MNQESADASVQFIPEQGVAHPCSPSNTLAPDVAVVQLGFIEELLRFTKKPSWKLMLLMKTSVEYLKCILSSSNIVLRFLNFNFCEK